MSRLFTELVLVEHLTKLHDDEHVHEKIINQKKLALWSQHKTIISSSDVMVRNSKYSVSLSHLHNDMIVTESRKGFSFEFNFGSS
jgi:hypothetical protein